MDILTPHSVPLSRNKLPQAGSDTDWDGCVADCTTVSLTCNVPACQAYTGPPLWLRPCHVCLPLPHSHHYHLHIWLEVAPLQVPSSTTCEQPPEWSVVGQVDCFSPWQPVGVKVIMQHLHPGHARSPHLKFTILMPPQSKTDNVVTDLLELSVDYHRRARHISSQPLSWLLNQLLGWY